MHWVSARARRIPNNQWQLAVVCVDRGAFVFVGDPAALDARIAADRSDSRHTYSATSRRLALGVGHWAQRTALRDHQSCNEPTKQSELRGFIT